MTPLGLRVPQETNNPFLQSLNSYGSGQGLKVSDFGRSFGGESPLPFQPYGTNPAATTGFVPDFWDKLTGYKLDNGTAVSGWGGLALGLGQGLLNGFMGMKQYGIMKDSLKESKRQFNTNFGAQKQMVNSQLEDRQRARLASNPNEYESLSTYMDKNRIR